MLQRWTAETHMRRWNFNAADPDSNLLLNRDVSRWNRDVSPFQLQFCECLNHNLCNLDSEWFRVVLHKSFKSPKIAPKIQTQIHKKTCPNSAKKMPSPALPKKMHRTEIRKYPPANPPKNLENNPPKTKLIVSKKTIRTSEEFPSFLRKTLPSFAEIA